MKRIFTGSILLALAACSRPAVVRDARAPVEEWPAYGNDAGSSRYSPLTEITKANVGSLKVAWTYHTGDISDGKGTWNGQKVWAKSTFEATPLMFDGTLYIATPFNRIIALEPKPARKNGPSIPSSTASVITATISPAAAWPLRIDPDLAPGEACRKTLYEATLDGRLIAVDAETGAPCAAFGTGGQVSLKTGINLQSGIDHVIPGEYHFTSAPAVVGDVVVVGSAINDNDRVEMPSGVVRGYNARTGALVWSWDPFPATPPIPPAPPGKMAPTAPARPTSGAPSRPIPRMTWSSFPPPAPAPTSSAASARERISMPIPWSPLRASTGKLVWAFQVVHHDLWDYDLPSASVAHRGGARRQTHCRAGPGQQDGPPVHPRSRHRPAGSAGGRAAGAAGWRPRRMAVPDPAVPGGHPFAGPRPAGAAGCLGPDALGSRAECRETVAGLRRDGIFTPPSLQGTLEYPGNAGGTNWGGVSFDRALGLIVVNQTNLPFIVQLIPREQVTGRWSHSGGQEDGWEYAPMKGTPYVMRRKPLLSPRGLPCSPPPWGTLAAVDASTGKIRWQVPLGTMRELAPVPLPIGWGTPTLGGPLTTAGGLTFIGATMDSTFRAFDTETGRELWHASVPASAAATPMTYRARVGGRQYVVVAAGGHGKVNGIKLGDSVVAFALP